MKTLLREYQKQGISLREYSNIHTYLLAHNTKKGICTNCMGVVGIKIKRTEWALMPGKKYSKNIKNYSELCSSCHKKQDYTEELRAFQSDRMKRGFKSGKLTSQWPRHTSEKHPTNRPVLKLDSKTLKVLDEYRSLEFAAQQFNGVSSSISNCISGRSHTAYGFKWKHK